MAFIAIAIVTVAESQVPAVRLPDGDAYRIVGGNRFAAAAILGAIVGPDGRVRRLPSFVIKTTDVIGFEIPICFAVGFVIAEAIVGRRFGGSPKADVKAP